MALRRTKGTSRSDSPIGFDASVRNSQNRFLKSARQCGGEQACALGSEGLEFKSPADTHSVPNSIHTVGITTLPSQNCPKPVEIGVPGTEHKEGAQETAALTILSIVFFILMSQNGPYDTRPFSKGSSKNRNNDDEY